MENKSKTGGDKLAEEAKHMLRKGKKQTVLEFLAISWQLCLPFSGCIVPANLRLPFTNVLDLQGSSAEGCFGGPLNVNASKSEVILQRFGALPISYKEYNVFSP